MESISDNILMLGVKNGNLNKLGLLFERYKKILFGFFYHMNHDVALSEDLVQNVFVRILKYRKGFKGDGPFKAWMFHIARNVNFDHYRKTENKVRREDISNWEDVLGDDLPNRELQMQKDEDLKLLSVAMMRLDEEKREVITLSKLDGMKDKQIGEILNCSEGAVKVKVFRALQALKAAYTGLQEQSLG